MTIGETGDLTCSADHVRNVMNWADSKQVSYLVWTWSINTYASCVPGNSSSLNLLADWDGTPTAIAPQAVVVRDHLTGDGA